MVNSLMFVLDKTGSNSTGRMHAEARMDAWSPFRDRKPAPERSWAPRGRGRRRQRLPPAPDGTGDILTDRDAAHAAETARQARTRPQAPAWERFGSQPVNPAARQHEAGDAILKLAEARCQHCSPVIAADTSRRGELQRAAGNRRDYGTGPAYEPSAMR